MRHICATRGNTEYPGIYGWCVTSTQPFTEDLFRYINANCPIHQGGACEATGTVVIPVAIQIYKIN